MMSDLMRYEKMKIVTNQLGQRFNEGKLSPSEVRKWCVLEAVLARYLFAHNQVVEAGHCLERTAREWEVSIV